ncbi:ABC transporter substrate-binding protein [Pseudonocardia eucalypti]|uniref:ABC transporter substrate-binding protein n=1 Tax=Pseudonocardia eucalypti TaxID=648755 RepID=A0ABP9QPB4_9PSEU|nr:putative spermidine/putrescine transport system substrate-binding protein [Pseudonocardia eucalypti]
MRARVLIMSAVAVALTAACGGGGGGGGAGPVTFVSTGGDFQEAQINAWQKPFTASTGTAFVNTGPPDQAKLKTMIESENVEWDVLDQGPEFAQRYGPKYLEKLDFNVVDRSYYPPGTVSDYAVPAYFYGTFMLYDTKAFPTDPPTGIEAFFDTKRYPGKRIVPPIRNMSVTNMLEFALLADGVPKDRLYPVDVDRALRKLDTIRSELVFADNYGQIQQAMSGRQATMVLSLTARAALAIKGGAPYQVIWQHTFANSDVLVVPKGAPNKDAAMKFIQFVAQPAQQQAFSAASSMAPGNPNVTAHYPDPVQRSLDVFAPEHKDTLIYTNATWWAENLDPVVAKVTAWSIG